MIQSMTGYGRAQRTVGGRDITVEIRAVNHRYLEFSSRVPRAYGYLEEKLKGFVQASVGRGKVEAAVQIQAVEESGSGVVLNRALAREYITALRELGEELDLPDDLGLSAAARLPDLFTLRKLPEDEDRVWADVEAVAREAMERFLAMRRTEGEKLREDILSRLSAIEAGVSAVEEQSPRTVALYRQKLTQKLQEILSTAAVDEQRILTEAAIVADRLAVDEETVRLRSHIAQLRSILETPGPVGRKLDFLVQEMNREANTIGSKAQDVAIAQVVVEMKSDIEKIREQVQNIE